MHIYHCCRRRKQLIIFEIGYEKLSDLNAFVIFIKNGRHRAIQIFHVYPLPRRLSSKAPHFHTSKLPYDSLFLFYVDWRCQRPKSRPCRICREDSRGTRGSKGHRRKGNNYTRASIQVLS